MKRRIVDENSRIVREFNVRDYSILIGQINNPPKTFRNKKKYTRKEKYRKNYEER